MSALPLLSVLNEIFTSRYNSLLMGVILLRLFYSLCPYSTLCMYIDAILVHIFYALYQKMYILICIFYALYLWILLLCTYFTLFIHGYYFGAQFLRFV